MIFLVTVLSLVAFIEGVHLEHPRDARFFRNAYTSTEVMPQMVTVLVPSSCVTVEPSLPPCRNVRNMDGFPRFLSGRIQGGDTMAKPVEGDPQIHSTPLGWGEYLGFYAPTVTVKAVHLQTTTLPDPRTVVTFSVKGCKPSRLPMDLDLCPSTAPEIQPSPTTPIIIASTTVSGLPPQETPTPSIEPTENQTIEPADNNPTQQLAN